VATLPEDMADKIATLGLGYVVGRDIFIGVLPERPDAVIGVNESGGQAPEFGFGDDGLKHETPNLQIVVRGARGDYSGPRALIQTIYTELPKIQGETVGGTYYHMVKPSQSPFPMTRDDDARVVFAFNALCTRTVA